MAAPVPTSDADPHSETFPASETADRLRTLLAGATLEGPALGIDASGRAFEARETDGAVRVRFEPPLIQPIPASASVAEYLDQLGGGSRRQLILLVQAGASSMGVWHGNELVAHKVIKKYVVRGKGRAQPTHLKTKGKSRYGSRLRLRNALAQLVETNEKLIEWRAAHGDFDDVFFFCPKRLWPDLFDASPPPPFERESAHRIPLDVHVPDFEELKRIRRKMSRGRLTIYATT